ncbi:MAG: ROK family protein [Chitinophagaceae bacterium]|nr:MAG: ROK family protein [Chitinophagaceae bacterium]
MSKNIVLGADIGGSHISASLVDIENRTLARPEPMRKEVDSAASADTVIREWASVIASCFEGVASSRKRVGIAMPGPVDYDEGICYIRDQHKYEQLYGHNIKDLLADALSINRDQIQLINDAAGFLAGEVFSGAGFGFDTVLGLTLGTGLGSALYKEGRVVDADLWQSPFRDGKAEDYLAGPWLLRVANAQGDIKFRSVKAMAMAAPGDARIRSIFEQFGQALGEFLVPQVSRHQPSVLVLGGNITRAAGLFRPALMEVLSGEGIELDVVPAQIGESAALIGAASLWSEDAFVQA